MPAQIPSTRQMANVDRWELVSGGARYHNGDSPRVTPHLYNDAADVARLFAALEAVGAG